MSTHISVPPQLLLERILTLEIVRDNLKDKTLAFRKDTKGFGDSTAKRLDEEMGGFSGAQVGMARDLAYRYLTKGYQETLEDAKRNGIDLIQFGKKFPGRKKGGEEK